MLSKNKGLRQNAYSTLLEMHFKKSYGHAESWSRKTGLPEIMQMIRVLCAAENRRARRLGDAIQLDLGIKLLLNGIRITRIGAK